MTVAQLHEAFTAGRATPLQVAERFLATQPVGCQTDAFVSVDPDQVLSEAGAATARHAQGRHRGPLDGVLVGIKDFFDVRGYVSRGGTSFLVRAAESDAPLVARLREAGAVIAGKNRTTELGLSPIGVNVSGGTPRNPHDPTRVTGGSSSGAGAAVGAGLVPLAIGTDGGGSVRIPPALCGVFGFKPTFGAIPSDGALDVGWWSLDHPGPIARCVDDLALGYEVTAGAAPPDLSGGEGLRVGVDWHWWGVPDTAVDEACRRAAKVFDLVEVAIAHLELVRIAEYVTLSAEVAAAMHDHLRDEPERFGLDVQCVLNAALALSAVDYLRAQQARTLLDRSFAAVFETVDVMVCPTTACTAPSLPEEALQSGLLDETLLQRLTAYTFPANLLGLPSVTVPVGVDPDGMPIGLMVTGPRGGDEAVLRVAAVLEHAGAAAAPHPAIWHDLLEESGARPRRTDTRR